MIYAKSGEIVCCDGPEHHEIYRFTRDVDVDAKPCGDELERIDPAADSLAVGAEANFGCPHCAGGWHAPMIEVSPGVRIAATILHIKGRGWVGHGRGLDAAIDLSRETHGAEPAFEDTAA